MVTREAGPVRLGIDFGTSTTVAVVAVPGREPRPLLFDGSPLLPSAVCVDPTGRLLVGRDALHTAMADPASFEPHPKQRVDDGSVLLGDAEVEVSTLFRAILDRVVGEAAKATGGLSDEPTEVVVTCPAAWGAERRATLLAAAPPGTRLVDEPVAAAHYFVDVADHHLPAGQTAVVYDFGAGTFDAAVVRHTEDGFTVAASRGVPDCGGLDIDAAIVAHLTATVSADAAWRRLTEPGTAADRRARKQLWDNVRTAKEMLSRSATTLVNLPLVDLDVPLGREELDRLAAPILDRTVTAVREVLGVAGIAPADLAAIFLAGGSSRMPSVVTTLHRAFGVPPVTVDQPELAVAEGSLRALPAPTRDVEPADWPEALPLPVSVGGDRRPLRRRRVRIALAAAAVSAIVGLTVTGLFAAGSDDQPQTRATSIPASDSSPSPSPSPSPTYPPGIDPCLLGTWKVTMNRVYGLIDGQRVQYAGGAGTVVTYKLDGTSFTDYSNMQPRTVVVRGVTWSDVHRGTTSARYFAENGIITATITHSDAVDTLRRNGRIDATEPVKYYLEPTQYRCDKDHLTTLSPQGNYSNEFIRVSGPPT